MLVLSRLPGQSVVILSEGTKILIKHLGAAGEKVKFGIQAPSDFVILREEVPLRGDLARPAPPPPIIDSATAQLAAIVANVDAPQDARLRALQQLVERKSPGAASLVY